MTAPVLTPDATRCPQCRAALTGPGRCGSCGISLSGPAAVRLWEVDTELLRLDAARVPLLSERAALLTALRGEPAAAVAASDAAPAAPVREPAHEWTPQRTSNALLGLGGLLLAGAALVFAAVTYERLGAGGRAVVLVALTVLAALAAPRARLRGLTSTAETLTAVALVLAALDAYGLRTLGLAADTPLLRFGAGSAIALALLSAAYAALVPVRVAGVVAAVLAQLPVPMLLLDASASAATAGLWLTALAAADLAVLHLLRRQGSALLPAVVAGCATAVTTLALLCGAGAALTSEPGAGALALLGVTGLLSVGAVLARDPGARLLLSALPVAVLALAASALAWPELSQVQAPLVPAAVALIGVQAAALLPRTWPSGPVLGAWAVVAATVAAVTEHAVAGLVAPAAWVADPWSRPAAAGARAALAPGEAWDGSLVTPVVLAAAAVAAVGGGAALHRLREPLLAGGALAAAAAVLLPLGADLPYAAAVAWLVLVGVALALVPRRQPLDLPLAAAASAVLGLAALWSLAERSATLIVLPSVAAALAVVALRSSQAPARSVTAALAGTAAAGELAALGVASGLASDQVGGLLLLAVAALAALADPRLGSARRFGLESAAAVVGLAAVVLSATDPGWLSWSFAGLALVATATALRPDRRRVAAVGGLLLSASSWVRLVEAGVTAPEPYVLPVAAVALALGHVRRRAAPDTRSFTAYGAGLTALLVPSLLASYAGSPLWRPLVLAGVALVVVLLGARERLQAPLAIGGAVLVLDALLLLAPYAVALPRWLVLGAIGALLLGVGATYEQRLRELGRLRDRYDALA